MMKIYPREKFEEKNGVECGWENGIVLIFSRAFSFNIFTDSCCSVVNRENFALTERICDLRIRSVCSLIPGNVILGAPPH